MNILKTSIATLLAAGAVHTALADVTLHVTGSTAFRAATVNGIKNTLTSTYGGTLSYAYDGSSLTGGNHQLFKVTGSTLGTIIVRTSWSGSVQGVNDLVSTSPAATYMDDSNTISSGGTAIASPSLTDAPNNSTLHNDVALSDTFIASVSPQPAGLSDASIVGIVPFAFVASTNTPAGVTNITTQLARNLFKGGFASASLFSNNPADKAGVGDSSGTLIYAFGRDNGSGTRLTALAETGIGVTASVRQYAPTPTGISGSAITQIDLTTSGGNGGYASGGTLADQLRYTSTTVEDANNNPGATQNVSFITYLGEGDSYRATNGAGSSVSGGNAKYLTYNGVAGFGGVNATPSFTSTTGSPTLTVASTTGLISGQAIKGTGIPVDATIVSTTPTTIVISANATASGTATATITNLLPNNIRNGFYTFWGYEHFVKRSAGTGYITDGSSSAADKATLATAINTQITNVDYFASGLKNDGTMLVSRSTDGGLVTQKY